MVSFPEWTTRPIPGVSLSAGGLLALADLSTVAQRTVITGGSTWLDSLLLAPGLHYQQAADQLAKRSGSNVILNAVERLHGGQSVTFAINNAATADYIQRIARPGETVTLDVGYCLKRSASGLHATIWAADDGLGWVSHVLYLISPMLTIAAIIFTILLQDWWTLSCLLALMLSRILNIYVIKQRSKPINPPPSPSPPQPPPSDTSGSSTPTPHHHLARLTEYIVSLGDGRSSVKLRGTPDDLRAVTSDAWLRSKTYVEGYLEAIAKLIVFLVAAVSGNMTQAGAIVMMALLLTTAGLLALSNANAKSVQVNGRVAMPETAKGGKGVVVEGRLVPAEGGGGLAEKGQGGYGTGTDGGLSS